MTRKRSHHSQSSLKCPIYATLMSKVFVVVEILTEGRMAYWRMQLHPSESEMAVRHTVESLSARYIGLDFATDVGDLLTVPKSALPENQRNYWAFAREMELGDWVLLFTHNFPFALARIAGPYNYIRSTAPEIGVWFRHFRRVDEVRYYGDFVTNARNWESIAMVATITPLHDPGAASFQLIERWLIATSSAAAV